MRNTKAIGLGTVLLSLVTCPVWSADRHVAAGHPGAADGASWETAFPTIQQALDAAGSNDVIRVKGGVYALESELVCAISFIRIEGGYEGAGTPGSNNPALWPTWITPSNGVSTRLLHLAAVTNVTLSRLGFRGGQTGADTRGGALLVTDAAGVLLDGCRVVSNLAFHASSQLAHGGGLYATNSTLVATNCTVRWNLAVATNHWNETRSLTAGGGGIYLAQSSAHLFNTDISDNAVTNVGRHATANIGFINIGGGLGLQGGELTARACTFRGNLNHVDNPSDNDPAAQGGGVAVTDGTAAFEACDFADNRAEGRAARGGGLFVNGGSMRLRGCRLWGNAVQGYNLYGMIVPASMAGSARRTCGWARDLPHGPTASRTRGRPISATINPRPSLRPAPTSTSRPTATTATTAWRQAPPVPCGPSAAPWSARLPAHASTSRPAAMTT